MIDEITKWKQPPRVICLVTSAGQHMIDHSLMLLKDHYGVSSLSLHTYHAPHDVAQSREILDALSRPSMDGKPRTVIMHDAHTLTIAAGDALLKRFEEINQGQDFLVIMVARNIRMIPRALLSRCHVYHLKGDKDRSPFWDYYDPSPVLAMLMDPRKSTRGDVTLFFKAREPLTQEESYELLHYLVSAAEMEALRHQGYLDEKPKFTSPMNLDMLRELSKLRDEYHPGRTVLGRIWDHLASLCYQAWT
jgi:hypothetical protein